MEKSWDNIAENIKYIREQIAESALASGRQAEDISLMAVTKTVPPEAVNCAVALGVHLLGENRAQELGEKYDAYQKENCSIHFIGALQTNKVRQIIDKVSMIQSVDNKRLAAEINHQAEKRGKVCDILIEVNIGGEAAKAGILPPELFSFGEEVAACPFLNLRGLMAIPPVCDTEREAERYFSRMAQLFIDIKAKNRDNKTIDILSMGMSDDYPSAIRQGATLVRIGSALFGARALR